MNSSRSPPRFSLDKFFCMITRKLRVQSISVRRTQRHPRKRLNCKTASNSQIIMHRPFVPKFYPRYARNFDPRGTCPLPHGFPFPPATLAPLNAFPQPSRIHPCSFTNNHRPPNPLPDTYNITPSSRYLQQNACLQYHAPIVEEALP